MKKRFILAAAVFVTGISCAVAQDALLDISRRIVNGVSHVNKFGRAESGIQTTVTDVWDRADSDETQNIWVAPTEARIHDIQSTRTLDDGSPASFGARTVRVFGLTSWDTDEVSEVVTLDGTTAVETANSYVIVHRMRVVTKGTSTTNYGIVAAIAQVDGSTTAQINPGEGQTQMAIYGIPSTKTGFMTRFYGTINKAQGAAATINFSLVVNDDPKNELTTFLTKNTRGLQSTGSSGDQWIFTPYFSIPGPAIVKVQGIASASDIEASAGFDIILVKS